MYAWMTPQQLALWNGYSRKSVQENDAELAALHKMIDAYREARAVPLPKSRSASVKRTS